MTLASANLIRVFDFYLAAMLVLGLFRRWAVYRDTFLILVAVRGRWPKLLDRMAGNKNALLNWATLRPAVLVLILMTVQMIASRGIWPQARILVSELPDPWWQLVPFLLTLLPMLAVDGYFIASVGRFDRGETEKYFDYAERWAGSRRARAIRVLTLGRIDPDRRVNDEVKRGLTELGATLSWAMWWVSVQMGCRLLFGLTIWFLWALR